ncbi:MAG: ABC transporter ATP-binding protein [Candidatus Eisenbacteria bacterium]|jgi:ABC-2 type transport system ATP-binding protein|nr:ABC transporter ATP-binding protein [Candidatus Eisenbacteria bacterium]
MIEVCNITKRFGPTVAVRNVNFSVPKGEVLGLLGPNGAGKTTTMRILTCYMPADEGTATVAGYDVHTDSLEVRKRIGYLPENAPLYKEMFPLAYLDFLSRVRGIPTSQRKARVERVVETCGLTGVLHKRIGEMSKGYQQRVGLAQTLIHEPEVLILDEPTTGLDPNQIKEIRTIIREIGREKTVILSTHILPEVQATCNRVIIMRNAELVADGSPQELSRRATGTALLVVEARGPADEIRQGLAALDGVKSVTVAGAEDSFSRLELAVTDGKAVAERVFAAAVRAGWTLRELKAESASLEQVFYELTIGEKEEQ